jgi:uncharacterized membrane protein YraQ (UPF0718 family)
MPADPLSTVVLILLTAADAVVRLWPYVVGGIAAAVLLSWISQHGRFAIPSWLPRLQTAPVAAVAGAASPLPTTGAVPLVLGLRTGGLPGGTALSFVLASSLLNPQLFVLTLGALGVRFALAQLGAVLLLSTVLGLAFGRRGASELSQLPGPTGSRPTHPQPGRQAVELTGHVGLYFLIGVLVGASFQVLLAQSGAVGWLADQGWLSSPALSWLAAPFYTCGGSAIPLAHSLGQAGFSPGMLFVFLLVGPALRGTTLANLGCLLSRRALVGCLLALLLSAAALGYAFDWLLGV